MDENTVNSSLTVSEGASSLTPALPDPSNFFLVLRNPRDEIIHGCHSEECNSLVRQGGASRMSFGIRHVSRDLGESYIQIHQDQQACSHDCAKDAIHARIEQHKTLQFGVYDKARLNPDEEYADSLVEGLAKYTPLTVGWAKLPKKCAFKNCQAPLSKEMYIVHCDYSRPAGEYPGVSYLEMLRQVFGGEGSADDYWLAGCCLDHAIAIGHGIVEAIFEYVPRHTEPHLLDGIHRALPSPAEIEAYQNGQTDPALPVISGEPCSNKKNQKIMSSEQA